MDITKAIEAMQVSLEKDLIDFQKNMQKAHIMITGGTGVGKSSLINRVFGKDLAEIGTGKPVTKMINKYESKEISVVLYDTVGYEIGKEEQFKNEILSLKDEIHIVWYCINSAGHRVTDFDLETIALWREKKVPVAVILTQCDLSSETNIYKLKNILMVNLPNISVFCISSISEEEVFTQEIENLVNYSLKEFPQIVQDAFLMAQQISLDAKWGAAHTKICQHAVVAFGVGLVPIPFANAPILVSNQMMLTARILSLYNLKALKNGLGAGFVGTLTTYLGKGLVGQIVKFIPGLGSIVGGMINGTTATIITAAYGEAVNVACYKLTKHAQEGGSINAEIIEKVINGATEFVAKGIENKKKPEDYTKP